MQNDYSIEVLFLIAVSVPVRGVSCKREASAFFIELIGFSPREGCELQPSAMHKLTQC